MSASRTPYTGPCLLPQLQPVRHCFHTFLSDKDAARLMRSGRCTTASLLADYQFVDRVFLSLYYSVAPHNLNFEEWRRKIAVFSDYRMRILRMRLSGNWNQPLVDSTGRSLLPTSLVALSFGQGELSGPRRPASYAAFDGSGELQEEEGATGWRQMGESEFDRRIRPVLGVTARGAGWDVFRYESGAGTFDQPIPPQALPIGLRFLQFNNSFNQPLQQGSIPDTVEVLQFGQCFNQPLEVGHLPASLTHLNFGDFYNQPLLPGVLPAGLRRLHLGVNYNQPLATAVFPSQLQQLSFGGEFAHPIGPAVIPPSVTHLRLSQRFEQPLQPGSIPHGVVHLNLGRNFNQPLLPGVLPTSLREIVVSYKYNHPLQRGSLPVGLEVLVFDPRSEYAHPLRPGVVPASVVIVIMGRRYGDVIVAGSIPATVKWLRLPTGYGVHPPHDGLNDVLSASTHVVFE